MSFNFAGTSIITIVINFCRNIIIVGVSICVTIVIIVIIIINTNY